MRIKRSYSDFKSIVNAKSLQIFEGDIRSDYYHLIAIDGQITYESQVLKNGQADQIDYETNILPLITNKISTEPDWDDFVTTFPTTVTELHTYKKGSSTVQTVLITYSSASKSQILRIQKTRV